MLVLVLCAHAGPGPAFPSTAVPMTAPRPEAFVPAGWALAGDSGASALGVEVWPAGAAEGDLTGDGVADRVLVLEPADKVGKVARPGCVECEGEDWTRVIVVLEAFGTAWMRVAVADWGDASLSARIDQGRLVVTTAARSDDGTRAEALVYRLDSPKFLLENRVLDVRTSTFDDEGYTRERVTEDWVAHLRVVEKGTPLAEDVRQKFTGARTLEAGPPPR